MMARTRASHHPRRARQDATQSGAISVNFSSQLKFKAGRKCLSSLTIRPVVGRAELIGPAGPSGTKMLGWIVVISIADGEVPTKPNGARTLASWETSLGGW